MQNNSAVCPVCQSGNSKVFPAPFNFIRHQDFMPLWMESSELWKCNICQTIYLNEQSELSGIGDIYRGEEYARKKKTEHVVFDCGGTGKTSLRTTYSCLADSIEREVLVSLKNKDSLRFLDIGCFDGKLLLELNKRFPNAIMHGFDISHYVTELFPKTHNFAYFPCDLGKIANTYDVLTIINVLCYVKDLSTLIKNIDRILKSGGFVFFVCTNIEKNPFFLTCGDQYTFQTPINLKNFWHHFGYKVELMSDLSAFPRSIVGIARRGSKKEKILYEQDTALADSLQYLKHAAAKLLRIVSDYKAENPSGRIVILGCTNNAAWAHNLAGDFISCFTDENPNRVGRQFYQKDVIHPSHLTEGDLLIIPYAKTSDMLAEKFSGLYKTRIAKI